MTGKQLKELRNNAMVSQLALAVIVNAAQADISNWERSEEVPPLWADRIKAALEEICAKPKKVATDRSKPPKPQEVDVSKCAKGCKYWRSSSDTTEGWGLHCCHYLTDTGHSRDLNQPAGECDKYDPSERPKKRKKPRL